MVRWLPLVAAVILLPAANAASLEFAAPAQLAGDLSLHTQWAVLVFPPEAKADLDLQLRGIESSVNHTEVAMYRTRNLVWEENTASEDATHLDLEHGQDLDGAIRFDEGFASLLIFADDLEINLDGRAEVLGSSTDKNIDEYLPQATFPPDALRRFVYPIPADAVAMSVSPQGPSFSVKAVGVHLLEWYGARLDCVGPCLPGGGQHTVSETPDARIYTDSYVSVETRTGTLNGTGSLLVAALGGTLPDAQVEGYARFPAAELQGQCGTKRCPNPGGQTFRANGTVALANLEPIEPDRGRLKASVETELDAASFDESVVPAFSTKAAAGLAVATAVVGFVLVKLLLAFFTRHHRPALEIPGVRAIFDLVAATPGLSFNELQRSTGAGSGQLARALRKLKAERLVVARPYRNSVRYYENHGRYDADWQTHAVLADEDNRRLHDWLLARPGSTQSQVLAGVAGWPRSTLQHSLNALREAGLLREEREGRFVHYWVVEPGSR